MHGEQFVWAQVPTKAQAWQCSDAREDTAPGNHWTSRFCGCWNSRTASSWLLQAQQICPVCTGGKEQCTIFKLQFHCCVITRDWAEQIKPTCCRELREVPAPEPFSLAETPASNLLIPRIYFFGHKSPCIFVNLSNCVHPAFWKDILIVWLSKALYKKCKQEKQALQRNTCQF